MRPYIVVHLSPCRPCVMRAPLLKHRFISLATCTMIRRGRPTSCSTSRPSSCNRVSLQPVWKQPLGKSSESAGRQKAAYEQWRAISGEPALASSCHRVECYACGPHIPVHVPCGSGVVVTWPWHAPTCGGSGVFAQGGDHALRARVTGRTERAGHQAAHRWGLVLPTPTVTSSTCGKG